MQFTWEFIFVVVCFRAFRFICFFSRPLDVLAFIAEYRASAPYTRLVTCNRMQSRRFANYFFSLATTRREV